MTNQDEKLCPLCGEAEGSYKRTLNYGPRLLTCSNCDLYYVSPFPSLDPKFYDQDYYCSWGMKDNALPAHVKILKEKNMLRHVKHIKNLIVGGDVLEVGCAMGSFLKVAQEEGFSVTGIDLSLQACKIAKNEIPLAKVLHGTLETAGFEPESFDVIFMSDVIEHVADPAIFLEISTKLLKNNGILYIITPDPRHWSGVLMGNSWVHFKEEHFMFFQKKTMDWICHKFDLKFVEFSHIVKYISLVYCLAQTTQFGPKLVACGVSMLSNILPQKWNEYLFPLPLGEAAYILRKSVQD